MNPVHVVDYDCVTCFGTGQELLWQSLLDKKCGFEPVTRFPTVNYVNQKAACIQALNPVPLGQRFPELLEKLCYREIDVDTDAVFLTATTKDNIERLEQSAKLGNKDVGALKNSIIDFFQNRWHLKSPGQNINTACASGTTAVLIACERIAAGQSDTAVICSADIVSEFVFSGFSALKAMSETTSRPFDTNRDGLILGEAAAFILLMSEERAVAENRLSLGTVTGWGMSSDAHHITAPDQDGRGLQRAIRIALEKAAITPQEIASINAHGTGTVYNDAMEITAMEGIFKDSIPSIYSLKGAIGHTLGACGLIEVIIALKALQEQTIPPVVGLQQPEDRIASSISLEAKRINGRYGLSVNSGFGGINTALVLEKTWIN